MPRATPTDRLRLADRLLMELVRVREEAAGHPAPAGAADAIAIKSGGTLAQRLFARAIALPDADDLRHAIRQVLQHGQALFLVVLGLAALSGALTAAAALDVGPPASLPLVLMLLVGSNLLMLLLWLVLVPASPHLVPGLGKWVLALWARFASGRRRQNADPRRPVMALLASGASGRWLAASLSHAAWLSFSTVALLTLLLLLSVRAYALSWDTTLLAPETVATWVRALSFGPALLGASADPLFIEGAPDRVAGQAGSHWLLAALLVYGVLPRLLALMVCATLWWRAQAGFGRDLHRTGFARLRGRLMPDHRMLGVVDPAPAVAVTPLSTLPVTALPQGPVLGLWLDDAEGRPPPDLPGVEWQWRGAVDNAASRQALRDTVVASPTLPVMVLARATMSPDRGAESFVADLRAATAAELHLMLVDMDRLTQRGAVPCRERVADWQALARRAGLTRAVLQWPQACP